eukprot:TRINITY_DN2595_c0_g1_i28.p1 TRINITY_DN2595_c0_g1~~TRINITY_DN2595_c0_g1_i28.p1  ORF type:complete len:473 (+),score=81.31 TRINITY_DN2595_c0_g1_i28:65-1483(+)
MCIRDRYGRPFEIDENAYFETIRKKHKKMVQFVGFDKIWKQINNLKEIRAISLFNLKISDLGPEDALGMVLPKLSILSLEQNLLYSWDQIYFIGKELPWLDSLQLTGNNLEKPKNAAEVTQITVPLTKNTIDVNPREAFRNLKTLILINMKLTWEDISNIIPAFANIEELVLCKNHLYDAENLKIGEGDLQKLLFLNVEETGLKNFADLQPFSPLPKLDRLVISKNELQKLGQFTGFNSVTQLSAENNLFEDPFVLHEMSQFASLRSLRILHNPFIQKFGIAHIRLRAIAENKLIQIVNGTQLGRYDRKDSEIYYLRSTFEEYFKIVNRPHYDYDFEDLMKYCDTNHPRIKELIQKYGNPYELIKDQDNSQQKSQSTQKQSVVNLKFIAGSGPLVGKDPIKKKFPESTTIGWLKNFSSKTFKIPQSKVVLLYHTEPKDPFIELEEDMKDFLFYGIRNNGEIVVDESVLVKDK